MSSLLTAITINPAERRRTQNRVSKRKSRAKEKHAAAGDQGASSPGAAPAPQLPTTDLTYASVVADPYVSWETPPDEPTPDLHNATSLFSALDVGPSVWHSPFPSQGPPDDHSNMFSPGISEALTPGSFVKPWTMDTNTEITTSSGRLDELPDITLEDDMSQVDGCNPMPGTPLHIAAALGHIKVARTLIAHGADINGIDSAGLSPIHYATRSNHCAMVVKLLEHGADVHSMDSEGCTPLYRAAQSGNNELVEHLLQYGARLY
ncbi:ankyrin repeat-containing domain protein [Ilyonectria robusta]|uniref:ankyrin repeat-containing domain protein n=1 Tax=Ilyonectria robusta TaxID=1079257 RepID=UPI001E8DC14E|nr:ankyrin repeat-containing domain protein [Ilyonectria robusta]KAH8664950.1 ankyrin repeat-containing domain protein [Ilyonectria robusta]